jgi:phosphoglycolate phosphatase-like HAD superfamily hydrolase
MSRRVAIFDVEGTLVDSVVPTLACWREVLAAHGFHFSLAELHRHSGRDPDDMIADLLGAAQGARLGETLKKEHGERYRAHFLAVTVGFAEVRRLFETLRKSDWSTALATSCGRGELSHYLALLGIEELVDAIACGEDVKRQKPHPDLVELALTRTGCPRNAAVMVGDTPYDAQAAQVASISAIGLACGGFPTAELRAAGCRAVYKDPADLLAGFGSSPFGEAPREQGGCPPAKQAAGNRT